MSRITKPFGLVYLLNGSDSGLNTLDFSNSNPKPTGFEIFNNSNSDIIYYKTNLMVERIPVFQLTSSQVIFDVTFNTVEIEGISGVLYYWVTYK